MPKYSNPNLYVCVCVCLFVCARVRLVHKNRFNCPSCFKSYRTMLDLAQHRCSAAAKNQVGVSVSEHVCEEESENTGFSCEEGGDLIVRHQNALKHLRS